MKRKLLLVGALVALFIAFILVRFFVFDKPNESGRLKVLSSPTAGVFLDNVPIGKTPYEGRVAPGEHTLKLIPEGENSQTVSWEGKIIVYENTLTFVSRELGSSDLTSAGEILSVTKMKDQPKGEHGQVSVVTDPAGAIIFLDNDEKGIAPLALLDVPAGEHELAVYLPGFFRRSQKIKVSKGHVVEAEFKLALDKTHKTLAEKLDESAQEASAVAALSDLTATTGTPAPENKTKKLTIQETPTGFLNVRDEPSTSGSQVDQVVPGTEYEYTEERNGWYNITLSKDESGWVSGDYIEVQ
ncbi:PEGA domain-containing protein [Candidatus Woesebacteria bacterium]|nr:PEGA domain-containing protein [Candidatus Woesebacteria bacterium]